MTIFDYIERHAAGCPKYTALQNKDNIISYYELEKQIHFYSEFLLKNICGQGDIVLLKVEDRLQWVILFLSLLYIDCWVVPLAAESTDIQIEEIKVRTKGKILIDDEIIARADSYIISNTPYQTKGSGGIYHMTSGSTYESKICVRELSALTNEGINYQRTLQLTAEDKILGLPPFHHSFALGAACMASIVSGACLFAVNRFVPREILEIVNREQISILVMVPVMAKLLTKATGDLGLPHNLRIAMVGAGQISKELYTSFYNKFGISLCSNYGSTETGGVIIRMPSSNYQSIGVPMENCQIKITNAITSEFGEEGELWVKTNSYLSEYLNEDGDMFDEEGYFSMHDIVRIDHNHELYWLGRTERMINIGGKKVNPQEVEQIIMKLPGVEECIVAGKQQKNGSEFSKAYIVGSSISEKQIREHCKLFLEPYKMPREIVFVDQIPKNAVGKIQYRVLNDEE